jgi:hypothetical protein
MKINNMEEWKIRQEIYHRINTEYSDDLKKFNIELTNDIVGDAIRYFYDRNIGWVYPSKSYMVAICYARWLEHYFGGDVYDYLNDPELLHGNDPYFVEYSKDPKTYHKILAVVTWEFNENSGLVPDVKEYFLKEFLIDEPGI